MIIEDIWDWGVGYIFQNFEDGTTSGTSFNFIKILNYMRHIDSFCQCQLSFALNVYLSIYG
jgi:hypothetical protein